MLEDCDELIRAEAKQGAGQNLARLLNLTDGLVGQGLDVLVCITTNEELSRLHPAVTRPGRCLAQIHVGRLPARRGGGVAGHAGRHRARRRHPGRAVRAARRARPDHGGPAGRADRPLPLASAGRSVEDDHVAGVTSGDAEAPPIPDRAQVHARSAPVQLHAEHLVDRGAAVVEVDRAGRPGRAARCGPGPAPTRRDGLVPVGLEVGHPGPQGERVVLAQVLDVADLEADRLQLGDDRPDLDAARRRGTRSGP